MMNIKIILILSLAANALCGEYKLPKNVENSEKTLSTAVMIMDDDSESSYLTESSSLSEDSLTSKGHQEKCGDQKASSPFYAASCTNPKRLKASSSADPEASSSADPGASSSADPKVSSSADPRTSSSPDPEASMSADPGASCSADPKEQTDAEIIEDSFKDFFKYITEDLCYQSRPVSRDHCILYMANTIENFQIFDDYTNKHPIDPDEPISLEQFRDLFNHFCNVKNLSTQECADNWILEDVFVDCRKLMSLKLDNYMIPRITKDQFCRYMGDTLKDYEIVNAYLRDHLQALQANENRDWIDLQEFSELFQNHCKKKKLSLKECARQRKAVTKVEKQKEMEFWDWVHES